MNEKNGIYPSIDQIWKKYYVEDELKKKITKRTVYREVFEKNKDYLNDLALQYFYSKINYGDFFNNINNTAKAFQEYGVKKGNFVTICVAGIPENAYCFYALSKIGAIANMIAPYFDKNDLINRIEDCESDILIIMDSFYDELKDSIKKSRIKEIIVLPALNSSLLRFITSKYKIDKHSNELYWNQFIKDGLKRKDVSEVEYEPNLPLTMVYSSGTTGAAKGILLSNDSFQNSVQSYPAAGIDLSRNQKFYQIIPPWYSTGLSTSLHLPLSNGIAVFMDPRFERDVFVKNIVKFHPNYAVAPTSMYEGFTDVNIKKHILKNYDLSFFDYPFEGGEPLTEEVAKKIEDVWKEHNNNTRLRVAYGQCECGAAITTQTQKINHSNYSVGIPLPGITIGIFDDEFNELSYNTRGNILAKTPCSMIEYYKNPEATKQYFHYDENGDKWNCTGDVGYISEQGELFVEGRSSDFSIINNEKIYNFDVEAVLLRIPEIKMCDVLEKIDNNDFHYLVAHIVFDNEFEQEYLIDDDQIMKEYKKIQDVVYTITHNENMVPVIFKKRSEFPHAKSGKRDVKKLKEESDGFIFVGSYNILQKRTLKQKI